MCIRDSTTQVLPQDVGPSLEQAENAHHVSAKFMAVMSEAIWSERVLEQHGNLGNSWGNRNST
eukprot:11049930-Prorocentrum_lima.AAC.1